MYTLSEKALTHASLLVCDRIMNESDTYMDHSLSDECIKFAVHVLGSSIYRLSCVAHCQGSGSLNLIACVLLWLRMTTYTYMCCT